MSNSEKILKSIYAVLIFIAVILLLIAITLIIGCTLLHKYAII
jgi:hypothetical protein